MGLLKGKVAVVTGGSGGIGSETVRIFLREGAVVHYTGLNQKELDAMSAEFNVIATEAGTKVYGYVLEVSDEVACRKTINDVVTTSGKLDILINNAGLTQDSLFSKMTTEQWKRVIDVDLNSVFYLSQEAFKHMTSNPTGGAIVNMSSIVGRTGNFGQANYAAAKGGLLSFSKTLAREGARKKVRVNAVCPGFIDTPMTAAIPEKVKDGIIATIPMQLMGLPVDIANACLFLCSDMGRYVTGISLDVNGGMFMG